MKSFYSAFAVRDGELHFFHWEKGVLYEEIKGKNYAKNAVSISSSGRFCICAENDELMIFSEETDGSLDFFRNVKGLWKKRTLINKGFPRSMEFKVFFASGRMIMVFGNGKNVMMSEFKDGVWQRAENIGEGTNFRFCGAVLGGFVLALWDKTGSIYLKRVNLRGQEEEKTLYLKNASGVLDMSFLCLKNEVFGTYLVKSMFSVQVWFKPVGENKKAIFVWEGIYADKVLLCGRGADLYVLWTLGDIYMFSQYDEAAHSFSEPKSGKAAFGGKAEKAYFTDQKGEFDFVSDEILYGQKGIPDIFVNMEADESYEVFKSPQQGEEDFLKDEEISRLSRLLDEKTGEVMDVSGSMKVKTRNLKKRIKDLEEEIERLKRERAEVTEE